MTILQKIKISGRYGKGLYIVSAIMTLAASGLVSFAPKFHPFQHKRFKELFVSMLEYGTQADILSGNLLGYKGAIFENLFADIFTKMGRNLYFFHKDSGLEVDFLMRYKGKCTLVEIKATTGNTKSTKTILKNHNIYHVDSAIKLGDYNLRLHPGLDVHAVAAFAALGSYSVESLFSLLFVTYPMMLPNRGVIMYSTISIPPFHYIIEQNLEQQAVSLLIADFLLLATQI